MAFTLQVVHRLWDPIDDNIDAIVTLDDGRRYGATFFTIANIQRLLERYRSTGECAKGLYFWGPDLIILRELTVDAMERTIADLIANNELDRALVRLESRE